jgi:hypothetical protein
VADWPAHSTWPPHAVHAHLPKGHQFPGIGVATYKPWMSLASSATKPSGQTLGPGRRPALRDNVCHLAPQHRHVPPVTVSRIVRHPSPSPARGLPPARARRACAACHGPLPASRPPRCWTAYAKNTQRHGRRGAGPPGALAHAVGSAPAPIAQGKKPPLAPQAGTLSMYPPLDVH